MRKNLVSLLYRIEIRVMGLLYLTAAAAIYGVGIYLVIRTILEIAE